MLEAKYDPGFTRDIKDIKKKHWDIEKLKTVMALIMEDTPQARQALTSKYKDHALTGDKKGNRECHVDNRVDWLLGYRVDEGASRVVFVISGSHDYLYGRKSRLT
jgi:mRNA interferase YafQ